MRSTLVRARCFQSRSALSLSERRNSKTWVTSVESATLRTPMETTLAWGTITTAPSSSRRMVTKVSFCPATSFTSMAETRQTPWFGYTTRSPTAS